MKNIKILTCNSELGAGTRGSSLGPDAIKFAALTQNFPLFNKFPIEKCEYNNQSLLNKNNYPTAINVEGVYETLTKNRDHIKSILEGGNDVLLLSGDHSNAAGFVAGTAAAFPGKEIGVIWIDAHGDLHSPYTSPSGNMHGMPLAMLLGLDNKREGVRQPKPRVIELWEKMKNLVPGQNPVLKPENLVFIDIRDLEDQEWSILDRMGIKSFPVRDFNKIPNEDVVEQTLQHLSHCDVIYVSFDVDSLDPSISRGTGTPVRNGLDKEDAIELLKKFTSDERCKVLEITEVNPLLDNKNKMAEAVVEILRELEVLR